MSESTKDMIAAAFRARMVTEAMIEDDHLPPKQEDECFRRQVHIVLTGPSALQVMADVDRFVELAMEVVYERAWVLGLATGWAQAMDEATKKTKRD